MHTEVSAAAEMDGAHLQFPVLSTNMVQKKAHLSGILCIDPQNLSIKKKRESWIIVC